MQWVPIYLGQHVVARRIGSGLRWVILDKLGRKFATVTYPRAGGQIMVRHRFTLAEWHQARAAGDKHACKLSNGG